MDEENVSRKERDVSARFPAIFHGKEPRAGLSFPDGWIDPIETLCSDLTSMRAASPGIRIEVFQVKEKFGSMSFYFRLRRKRAKLPDGGLGPLPAQTEVDQLLAQMRKRVEIAQVRSRELCVRCGEEATRMSTDWILPFCDEHFKAAGFK